MLDKLKLSKDLAEVKNMENYTDSLSNFAKTVTEMIRDEKDTFLELIEKEDWHSLEDEIYECASLFEHIGG